MRQRVILPPPLDRPRWPVTVSSIPVGQALVDLALDALDDLKGVDPVVIDVRELSSVMDYLVVASGTSARHVKSLADNVIDKGKASQIRPIGIEGESVGEWVLVDYGDVVVHVMQPATRSFYDLERLWSAPPVDAE